MAESRVVVAECLVAARRSHLAGKRATRRSDPRLGTRWPDGADGDRARKIDSMKSQRSSGRNPVRLATLANIRGPISS